MGPPAAINQCCHGAAQEAGPCYACGAQRQLLGRGASAVGPKLLFSRAWLIPGPGRKLLSFLSRWLLPKCFQRHLASKLRQRSLLVDKRTLRFFSLPQMSKWVLTLQKSIPSFHWPAANCKTQQRWHQRQWARYIKMSCVYFLFLWIKLAS